LRTVSSNWHRKKNGSNQGNASKHANMKELRFDAADGAWRFYRQLIAKADERFSKHLIEIRKEERKNV